VGELREKYCWKEAYIYIAEDILRYIRSNNVDGINVIFLDLIKNKIKFDIAFCVHL